METANGHYAVGGLPVPMVHHLVTEHTAGLRSHACVKSLPLTSLYSHVFELYRLYKHYISHLHSGAISDESYSIFNRDSNSST
jgi:hypothetical protein